MHGCERRIERNRSAPVSAPPERRLIGNIVITQSIAVRDRPVVFTGINS